MEKIVNTMLPNAENIVLVSKPEARLEVRCSESILFPGPQKQVGVGATENTTHGDSIKLEPQLVIKNKLIGGEE